MSSDRGRYQLKARAIRQEETRQRIVAATSKLHEEVGPARTSVAEIARRAGVERLTVYNNFPDVRDLLGACQAHFLASHPPPALGPDGTGRSQLTRLEEVLCDLYGWYRANQSMERNVHRDRHLVRQLDELMRDHADRAFVSAARGYARALATSQVRRKSIERLVAVAMEFGTWDLLAVGGAGDGEIARLFAQAVGSAAGLRRTSGA